MILTAQVWSYPGESSELKLVSSLSETPANTCSAAVNAVESLAGPVISSGSGGDPHVIGVRGPVVVGVPIIAEDELKAVLTLEVECLDEASGAIEIWSRDSRDELALTGAVFSNLNRFARVTQHVRFPRASGLPGESWEDREPKLISGLGRSPGFMRASGARVGGLEVGLALPIMTTEHNLHSVLVFLSSTRSPIAKVFEIWDVDDKQLRLRNCVSTGCAAVQREAEVMTYACGEGFVGRVIEAGIPVVTDDVESLDRKRAASLRADRIRIGIGIPVYVGTFLKSVVVLLN